MNCNLFGAVFLIPYEIISHFGVWRYTVKVTNRLFSFYNVQCIYKLILCTFVNEVTIVESMDMALPKLYAAENGGRGGATPWEDTSACCYE